MTIADLRATDRERLRRLAREHPGWSPVRLATAFARDVEHYTERTLLVAAGEIGAEWHRDVEEAEPEVSVP